MKARLIVPPLAALLLVAGGIGVQRSAIMNVKERTDSLQKAIAGNVGTEPFPAPGERVVHTVTMQPVGWEELGEKLGKPGIDGRKGSMRTMLELHQQLQGYTLEALRSALKEVAARDLPEHERSMLEEMLLSHYVQKAPEEALKGFSDRIGEKRSGMTWHLADALKGWAEKNPLAAVAWFEREIAAGTFGSESLGGRFSRERILFEASLVTALIDKDPAAAERRLRALPFGHGTDLLHQAHSQGVDARHRDFIYGTFKPEERFLGGRSSLRPPASSLRALTRWWGISK